MAERRVFPKGFLWGAATASYQVEGGDPTSDWWVWEHQANRIVGGHTSGQGSGWWGAAAEDDLRRAAALGLSLIRVSVEWGRLEPAPGQWDEDAFRRYLKLLETARELGLTVSLTINHFTLPLWAAKRGGWRSRSLIRCFESLARRCAERLGGSVTYWTTLNEPGVLAQAAYLGTRWPPGDRSLRSYQRALTHLLEAHVAGYQAVKSVLPDAQVGLVLAMPMYRPASAALRDRMAAQGHDWIFNGSLLYALKSGWVLPPISPVIRPIPGLDRAYDWLGLNYYGAYKVAFSVRALGSAFGRHVQIGGVKTATSDWGEPDPTGMVEQLRRLAQLGVPLFVTENGIFNDRPGRQTDYLTTHVQALHDAIRGGVDVRGYCWWTLVDNFEWAEGWNTGFGLYALDHRSQARTEREVARRYRGICHSNALPE